MDRYERPIHLNLGLYASALRDNKVATWDQSGHKFRQIPASVTPTRVSSDEWDRLAADAQTIIETFPRVLAWLQRPQNERYFDTIFAGLSGIELAAARLDPLSYWGHASIRMDLFWDHGSIKIIEVNCTIPAMQSYSDSILKAWRAAGGIGDSPYRNEVQLLNSLYGLYRANGGFSARPGIVILHRPGDSQIGELLNLRTHWERLGHRVALATPDQIEGDAGIWRVGDEIFEIVYRHIFAWRLSGKHWEQWLLNSPKHHIYNPVSAHYECKSFLAFISEAADSAYLRQEIGLSLAQTEAIQRRVPWSRILSAGSDNSQIENLSSRMSHLVLKRAVGYGGHEVILGRSWHEDQTQDKLRSLLGVSDPVSELDFLNWARGSDTSCWIAQELMSGARRRTEMLINGTIESWDAWYDASIFVSTGGYCRSRGGVSRIASGQIVNIGTGGGLAPFLIVP